MAAKSMEFFFYLFLLLCSTMVISTSSRGIHNHHDSSHAPKSTAPSTYSSHAPTSTTSHSNSSSWEGIVPGPILTNGKNYTYVCDPSRFASMGLDVAAYAYCDKSLPYAVRVKDLVDSMTLAEKIGQLGDQAVGAPRIGLPKYNWWSEALHGVSFVGHATYFGDIVPGATSFPTVIVSAASFNASLWNAIGQVVSTEARAMYNVGHAGLTFWSPNINVARDPRWGRIQETPGEDPFVVGTYASQFVRGLQDVEGRRHRHDDGTAAATTTTGDQQVTTHMVDDLNSRPLKVSACCKHYAAYDVDNWLGVDRYHFDARVTEQDMIETFVRPFEMCVADGDVSSVMCSYNRVDGIPACADPKLLSQTIRGDWNLHGYIVSDCDSIEVMLHGHKWLDDTPEDAVAQAIRAGMDLDCGIYYTNYTGSAVSQGKVRQDDIDKALTNLYVVLMRLGYFDGNPVYEKLGKDDVCTEEHIELAADAARQGIVLLKNNNATLPLSKSKYKNFALVGPHANATNAMIGNYQGTPCRLPSPLDVFSEEVNVDFKIGCDVACKNESLIFPAMRAAKKADATLIFVGLDLTVEAESLDRIDLLLPGYQTQLINQVAGAAAGPVVLVILSAGGVDISFAEQNPNIDAIVWAGYPGGEGARAIADVIFGRHNPSGRLPITWYKSDYADALPMTSMQLRPDDALNYPGRTYKFFNGTTVFPFGYGLSYTHFNYTVESSNLRSLKVKMESLQHCRPLPYKEDAYVPPCPAALIKDTPCREEIRFDIEVVNNGNKDGTEAVLVYSKPPSDIVGTHIKQLVSFKKVFVAAGKSEKVKFSLNVCKSLGIVEETGYHVLPSGEHTIEVGNGDAAVSFPVHVSFHY